MLRRGFESLMFAIVGIALIAGCQSTESEKAVSEKADLKEEIAMESEEDQMAMLNDYTYEDYKQVFEKAESEAERLETEDELLNKWIFRTLAQEKLYMEADLTEDQILQLARESMKENKAWKSHAKEEYGIRVTDEEVDAYISKGPDTSEEPQHLAIAEALGMGLEEYNHHYDRDLYEKSIIWEKLKPALEEKYDTADNNQLVKEYEEEMVENMES